jgi:RNA polymerase sigma factor for flagellar operon FliA
MDSRSQEDGDARRSEREALFLASLPEIERAARFVARRNRLSAVEAEELLAEAKLALIDHDYRILGQFEGRSSLRTYLLTVIQRLFLDRRRRQWGKWRPSARATRLGPLALRLESLLYRDGLSLDEACQVMESQGSSTEARVELVALAGQLPVRTKTIEVPIDDDPAVDAASPGDPETRLRGQLTAERCQAALERALRSLPADDRVVLRLRFEDGVSVADIARGFRLDQKGLYRRIDRVLAGFRRALEADGISWGEVEEMIAGGHSHLRLPLTDSEYPRSRTSLGETAS